MKKNFFLIVFSFLFLAASSQTAKNSKSSTAPKLVVGIVVDQMRYDFIYRYWDKFGNDGFRKLVNDGFFCKNTNFDYAPTYTGPGHAAVYSGTTPAINGIAGNIWYDRNLNRKVYCSEDKSVKTVGSSSWAGQMSPKNLLTTTICDQLRLSTNMKSKVIGIGLKDRGAILPAGHTANAAYWFDDASGNWITSTFYMNELPKWVNDFNAAKGCDVYLSQKWNTLLPIEQYTESLKDFNLYEGYGKDSVDPVFPYDLPELRKKFGPGIIRTTPFGNCFTRDFATEVIRQENLGKNGVSDFLCFSFSSTDYLGHLFGPQSVEIEDTYLRLDRDIADFLKFLDTWVGKNNVLVFLTADHAAVDVSAHLTDMKIPSGYGYYGKEIEDLKKYFQGKYGDSLILAYENQQIYLNRKLIMEKNFKQEEIENYIAGFFRDRLGIAQVVTATALNNCSFTDKPRMLIQRGCHAKRSGDVMLNFEPGWVDFGKTGTTHGSPYSYDTHVPLIFYGWNIKPGSSTAEVSITDIAPTIASMLNIEPPNGCTGKVIQDIKFSAPDK